MVGQVAKDEKISYVCGCCGAVLRRKVTEPEPRSCNYCHTETPEFSIKA